MTEGSVAKNFFTGGFSKMKIKKLICVAVTVVMLAAFATVAASAATLSITQNYMENVGFKLIDKNPESVGAAIVHNMYIDGDAAGSGIGYMTGSAYEYWHPGVEVEGISFFEDGITPDLDISYVAYKISADEGSCIDTLNLGIQYIVSGSYPDVGRYLQQAVYVLDRIDFANKKGKIDFSDKTPVKLLGGGWEYDGKYMNDPLSIDLTQAVKDFGGERKTVYVVIASFSNSSLMGQDEGRHSGWATQYNRLCAVDIQATQTTATGTVTDPVDSLSGGSGTESSETKSSDTKASDTKAEDNKKDSDNTEDGDSKTVLIIAIAAAAVVVVAVVAVVVAKSKKK